MKVKYKGDVRSYRGNKDGLVYYYNHKLDCYIAREYRVPRYNDNNRRMGAVARNLRAIDPSQTYLNDLKIYLILHNERPDVEKPLRGNQWALYNKLMWAMARDLGLDLETLSRAAIESAGLPCRSVKQAVEAGLLAEVPGYEMLVGVM